MKSGIVAVVGRPSSGKSTLVNALCGGKVSIVSPVPQTTRNRVRGILNAAAGQIVFIDTPGFHVSEKKLNRYMTGIVTSSLSEVEVVLYVVDGTRAAGEEEKALQTALRAAARPLVVCVNKSDSAAWSPDLKSLAASFPGAEPREVSALKGSGLDALKASLFSLCPEGEQMYPEDYYTDQTTEFRITEIVREKAMLQTRDEVPHSIYVRLEDLSMQDEGTTLWARGFICVERESQKGILVGREGARIKAIVQDAQRELAEIFPWNVKLDIRVKVDRDWRTRDPLLKKMIR